MSLKFTNLALTDTKHGGWASRGEGSVVTPEPYINTPSITSPTEGATDTNINIAVTSSAFSVANGGSDTHTSSDWQFASDSGFSNIVEQSLADTTNKTSYTSSSLSASTEYWVRVRHTGSTYGDSSWSTSVSFTTAAAPAYDTDAQAFFDAMGTAPNDAVKTAVNDLVVALKATTAGWTGADLIYTPRMPTLADSLLNLRNPATFPLTAVNSPTHTPYLGIAGNGTSSYLNTGWRPSTNGVNFTKDNAGMGIWIEGGTDTASISVMAMGATVSSNSATILPWMTANRIGGDINSGSTPTVGATAISTRLGYTAIERVSSATLQGYRDGSGTGSSSTASTNMPTNELLLGCRNFGNPYAVNFSDNQIRAVWVGSSLGATDQAAVYAAFAAFDTAMAAAAAP